MIVIYRLQIYFLAGRPEEVKQARASIRLAGALARGAVQARNGAVPSAARNPSGTGSVQRASNMADMVRESEQKERNGNCDESHLGSAKSRLKSRLRDDRIIC